MDRLRAMLPDTIELDNLNKALQAYLDARNAYERCVKDFCKKRPPPPLPPPPPPPPIDPPPEPPQPPLPPPPVEDPPPEPPEDGPGDPPEVTLGGPPELDITKEAAGECVRGEVCNFTITVTNNGPGTYSGPISLTDTVSENPVLLTQSSGKAACVRSGQTISCQTKQVTLTRGQSYSFQLGITFARSGNAEKAKNCVMIDWPGSYAGPNASPEVVRAIQTALKQQGPYRGFADGKLNATTLDAIKQFRISVGLPPRAGIDQALINELFGDGGKMSGDSNPANDKACVEVPLKAPEDQVADKPTDSCSKLDLNGRWVVKLPFGTNEAAEFYVVFKQTGCDVTAQFAGYKRSESSKRVRINDRNGVFKALIRSCYMVSGLALEGKIVGNTINATVYDPLAPCTTMSGRGRALSFKRKLKIS